MPAADTAYAAESNARARAADHRARGYRHEIAANGLYRAAMDCPRPVERDRILSAAAAMRGAAESADRAALAADRIAVRYAARIRRMMADLDDAGRGYPEDPR